MSIPQGQRATQSDTLRAAIRIAKEHPSKLNQYLDELLAEKVDHRRNDNSGAAA